MQNEFIQLQFKLILKMWFESALVHFQLVKKWPTEIIKDVTFVNMRENTNVNIQVSVT